jgi:hypothetical protein
MSEMEVSLETVSKSLKRSGEGMKDLKVSRYVQRMEDAID